MLNKHGVNEVGTCPQAKESGLYSNLQLGLNEDETNY